MNFADPIDEAAAREQQMIELALANRHSAPTMVYTGECHYCEEPIDSGHFCTPECRDDHAKVVRAEQQRKLS